MNLLEFKKKQDSQGVEVQLEKLRQMFKKIKLNNFNYNDSYFYNFINNIEIK